MVGEEEEDIDEEFAEQSLPKTPLPEHRVEMIDSVDKLQDEFCMQTSPELPRAEVRQRIVTSDLFNPKARSTGKERHT